MRDKWTFIIILFVLLLIIAAVVILLLFREKIFNTGKQLAKASPKEKAAKGYGSYYTAYESPCITNTGKCNTAGIKYTTEYCTPHPETKKGCINDNGEMSFAPRTSNQLCQPNCRAFVLKETTPDTNVCAYDNPYNSTAYTCVPSNAQMFEYRTYSCIKNDSIGDNTCTYQCNSSGFDSAGIAGDSDSTKLSYIPACAKSSSSLITLNSFNWNNIYNIGNDPSKGNLSKGYQISNLTLSNGKVDPQNFHISPAYPPWSSSASNTITLEELKILDTTLTVYDNCFGSNVKPLCENWYYAKPLESINGINTSLTYQETPELCTMDSNFTPMKECFYNAWYSSFISGTTGLAFINPYTGGASGPNTVGATGAVYSWIGIGSYGYYASPMICETKPKNFTPNIGGPTGTYIIPSGDSEAACLNLSAAPNQCANSFENLFAVTPSQNLSTLIAELDNGTYNPVILNSYPGVVGDTYYTCRTQFTNKINDNRPGCVQTCQYIPPIESIDFTASDANGNFISPELQDLIGAYITIQSLYSMVGGGIKFFGTLNEPCNNLSNAGVPNMSCLRNATAGASGYFYPNPCGLIFNGGVGITGGNYYSKSGCDAESIQLATELKLIFSPVSAYGVLGPGATSNSMLCDIYAEIDGYFGYLSTAPIPSNDINAPNLDISSAFTYDNTNLVGNIVANINTSTTNTSAVYFNVLNKGENIPPTTNNGKPHFILTYDPSTYLYTLKSSDPYYSSLYFLIGGAEWLPPPPGGGPNFQFTNLANANAPANTFNNVYTKTLFTAPIIKTEGLYAGYDVTRTINLQRNLPCYTKATCEGPNGSSVNPTLSGATGVCYSQTCNLHFNYNPEFC